MSLPMTTFVLAKMPETCRDRIRFGTCEAGVEAREVRDELDALRSALAQAMRWVTIPCRHWVGSYTECGKPSVGLQWGYGDEGDRSWVFMCSEHFEQGPEDGIRLCEDRA